MKDASKPARASRLGGKLVRAVSILLLVALGFVLGVTSSNAMFLRFYLPFVPPLLSSTTSISTAPPSPPPPPQSPPPPSAREESRTETISLLGPSGVMHNMTDEELFWRASLVPKVRRSPERRVPKVAFLFLVRGELPLRPLWEKFFAGHEGRYSVYVHAHPSYTGSPPPDSVFYGRMVPSQVITIIL